MILDVTKMIKLIEKELDDTSIILSDLRVSILESLRSTGSVGIRSLRAEKAVFTLQIKLVSRFQIKARIQVICCPEKNEKRLYALLSVKEEISLGLSK